VSFASLTTPVCTASGATVTVVAAGTCTIRATQAGNATYAAAANVDQSFSVSGAAPPITFAPTVTYATGSYPESIALGDFNGDGIPDLAVANALSANVSVLIGHSDGTFTAGTSVVSTGASAEAVAVGDFNGDGKLDLAICDFTSGNVIIFAGNGDGTFHLVGSFFSGLYPVAIAVADLDHDGKLDLVVANTTSGTTTGHTVSVLMGNGDGSFRAAVPYVTGTSPYGVVVGDFNGDGKPDLAVANFGDNTVSILKGNGDGTFAAAVAYATAYFPDGVAIGDFNGDGKLDLAVVSDNANVSILLGHGDGTFGAATNFTTGSGSASVAVADFNGDGRSDLAIVNRFDNNLVLLIGNGDGTFQAPQIYSVGASPSSVVARDLNGDGKPDVVVNSHVNNNISVLLQSGGAPPASLAIQSGSPQTAAVGSAYAAPLAVRVRDAGSNPLPGVSIIFTAPATGASGTFSGSGSVAQATSNASGVATAPAFTANATVGSFSVIASVAALNASFALTNTAASSGPPAFTDGPPPNGTVNASYSFTVTASGTPAPTFSVLPSTLPTGLSLNGTSGLIAGTPSAQGTFAGMLTASNGVPPAATQAFAITIAGLSQTITFGPLSSKPLGSAPFAVSATASSGLPVSFLSQTTAVCTVAGSQVTLVATGTCTIRAVQAGNATYGPAPNVDQSFQVTTPDQPPTVTLKTPANNSTYVAPAIVPLYAAASDPDGTIAKVEFYNGGTLLGTATSAPYTYPWTAVGAGSYPVTAKAYDNQGATTVSAVANITVNAPGQHVSFIHSADLSGVLSALEGGMVLGDFNGDAKLDVILTDAQCERAFLQGDGTGGFVLHQGLIPASGGCGALIAADFNGDGKLDVAVQTGFNQSYYVSVNLGHGDGTLSAANAYLLPASASHVISGDFNGDGKLDIAAALNDGTVALLLGNGDGTFQAARVFPAGSAFLQGIAAGDVNGDGKLDLVVSDPSNRSLDVLLGNGDGTFQAPRTIVTGAFPAYPQEIALGDFSGDGKLDIAVTELFTPTVSILLGNGDGTFQPAFDYPAGNATGGIVAAEFNGDGRLDLAVANGGDNTVSILAGNGNGSFQAPVIVATGGSPRQIITGDLNGDGLLDMVVSNSSSTSSLSVLINTSGRTPTAPIFTNGPPPDGVASAAYLFTFTASGFPAPQFTLNSASLPIGALSLGGILSGSLGPGLYTGVVTASNGVQPDATQAFSFVVHASNQTINFPPIADVPLNLDCVFTAFLGQCENEFAATASSGMPVTFLSLTPDTCTLTYVPNVTWYFTTIAAGTCIIRAEQQGGASFAAAPPVDRSFQITAVSAASAAFVLITSPSDHQGFVAPGSITITASARYLTGLMSAPPQPQPTDPLFVDFDFDGIEIGVVATNPPSNTGTASVTWNGVTVGTHVISAKLREFTPGLPGGVWYGADSTPVTIVVTAQPDTPTITLTAPANGSSYVAPATVVLAATATNAPGTVAKVDFYDGATAIGTSTLPPYAFTWTNVRAGTHVLSAKATSGNGVVAASAGVSISVGSGIDSLVALYTFDDSWSSSKPVQEPIGNSYGEVQGVVAAIAAPPVGQKPDTCRAASFGGGVIDAFALPVPTSSGGVTTLAFWMNWNGTDGAMPLSWTTEGLVFSGGSFGFTTTGTDVYGIASTSLANTWHHVVAEFHNGSVTANRLIIDGVAQSLSQRAGTPTLANATTSNTLRFGGQSGSSIHRFAGALDDVQVFDGMVTDAHVAELVTAANPCAVVAVRLLAPSQNASYNAPGTIEFLGVATTTNTRINQVALYDGATLVTTLPFGFNTATFRYTAAGVGAGTHAYTLRVTDSSAQTATSSPPVTATVYQVTGTSTVALTVPGTGSTLYTSDPIHLNVAVTPGSSYGIYLVQYFANGQLVGQRFSAPYLFTWKFPSPGTYSIVAEVIDTSGHSVFSTPTTITVLAGEPQLVYFYNDAAGTPLAATDQNGTLLWMETYAPYGARYTNDDTSTKNGLWYTGKPTEDVTGLAYYGARWYSPSIGRFYSTDPARFREDNPLSFNRYAYGNNNSYKFVDPDGRDAASITDQFGPNDQPRGPSWNGLGPPPAIAQAQQGLAGRVDRFFDGAADLLGYIFKSDSVMLARNMARDLNQSREPGEHAHHIVAANEPLAEPARQVLANAGMDINSAFNGVFLDPSYHMHLHTNAYYQNVNLMLSGASSYTEVAARLTIVRGLLTTGTFPY
jgi:RHS repeat-associated protein